MRLSFSCFQSIRKTYEQIVKRLKEERIGFDNQLAAIERTLKAKEKDLEELVLMSHDAQHAKEVAKAELLKLEHQLMEEKKQREKELADRRALVQQKVEMNQRMEKRDKMRREMSLVEGAEQSDAGDATTKKSLFSSAFHSALNEHVLEEEQKKITTYEEAFRKIKDATGVSDVNEVIQKFLTQDETHNNLVVMTKEAQARIDALNEEKAQAKAKVEEIKYSGTGSLGSRRIVDEFESHLSEANSKCERNKQKYERIAKILINVKSGVEHLADKLEPISVDQDAFVMTDSTVVEVATVRMAGPRIPSPRRCHPCPMPKAAESGRREHGRHDQRDQSKVVTRRARLGTSLTAGGGAGAGAVRGEADAAHGHGGGRAGLRRHRLGPRSRPPLTWSPLTWSPLTWSPLTWSPLTWSPLTWSPLTWSPVTSF